MSKTKSSLDGQSRGYKIFVVIVLALLAVFFIFPLYWILTGSLKDAITINARTPQWFPLEPTLDNYVRLFKQPAIQWLLNTIIIAVAAMALTCITAALAGYALAKKRFWGQTVLFSLLVCAMALPKQVIVIPLLQEMSALGLNNNLLAVILPTVGWPFGIFLMKQFSETIPTEMLEAARIDGANPVQMFFRIKLPYLLSVQGPSLVTDFVKNINNFNVIYLLTQDVYVTADQAMASSSAKEVDLLVTWLFRLTQEQYNYKMAAVIGIMVFIICAVFTVVCFRFINKKEATFS